MSNGLKFLLIILVVAVFGAIGYFLFFAGDTPISLSGQESPLQTSQGEPVSGLNTVNEDIDAEQIGQEFLTQLLNIRSIKLRDDVFSRPAFVSLVDFTIELVQPGNEGRYNPFAPFGFNTAEDGQIIIDPETGLPIPSSENSPDSDIVIGSGNVTPIIPSSGNTVAPNQSPVPSGQVIPLNPLQSS